MKKLTALIMTMVLAISFCLCVSAQVLTSDLWGISLTLSDNWNQQYTDDGDIIYKHKTTDESLIIGYENTNYISTRDLKSVMDSYYDDAFSNYTLASELVSGFGTTITENYHNRRFESYNGVEYYRAEELYHAKKYGYEESYFYKTMLITVQNGKCYIICYICKGSSAPNFADVTNMLNSMTYGIGFALKTDITAKINGHPIPSYNVGGYTYVCVEDLRNYGFAVYYDNASRSLSVTRDYSQVWVSRNYTKPYVPSNQVGQVEHAIVATDICTYFEGYYVNSYNINGQTIIRFDDLQAYGDVAYNNDAREMTLTMRGIN